MFRRSQLEMLFHYFARVISFRSFLPPTPVAAEGYQMVIATIFAIDGAMLLNSLFSFRHIRGHCRQCFSQSFLPVYFLHY